MKLATPCVCVQVAPALVVVKIPSVADPAPVALSGREMSA
jgi:hypothetical protein